MKQDKFLTGILIGVGMLVLLALVLFFTRQDKRDYLAEDAPEGVAHNYVLAVLNKDYEKAYGYLADLKYKPCLLYTSAFRACSFRDRCRGWNFNSFCESGW